MPVALRRSAYHVLLRSTLTRFVRHLCDVSPVFSIHTASSSCRPPVMGRKQGTSIGSTWRASSRVCRRRTRSSSRCSSKLRPLVSLFMTGRRKNPRILPSNYSTKSSCPRRTVASLVSSRSPVCFCLPFLPAGVWYLTLRLQPRITFRTHPSTSGVRSAAGRHLRDIQTITKLQVTEVYIPRMTSGEWC